MDARRCDRCAQPLVEGEDVTLWCERHGPRQRLGDMVETSPLESYVAVLCRACGEQRWPVVRDAVRHSGMKERPAHGRP